jgi:predicted transcriptional regulator
MSVLEIAKALHVSKATAMRTLDLLQDRGFIVLIKMGAFSTKVRHASEWRLTEFPCDVTGAMATKDFTRWPKEKNTVSD